MNRQARQAWTCALQSDELVLQPGGRVAIPTGLIMEIPEGFEGQVRPRSGLALKHGITCLNSPRHHRQ